MERAEVALVALLVEAGYTTRQARRISSKIEKNAAEGETADDLAGALLRWRRQPDPDHDDTPDVPVWTPPEDVVEQMSIWDYMVTQNPDVWQEIYQFSRGK